MAHFTFKGYIGIKVVHVLSHNIEAYSGSLYGQHIGSPKISIKNKRLIFNGNTKALILDMNSNLVSLLFNIQSYNGALR